MIFTLELRAALADRRLFILNSTVPLFIVAPVSLGAAPPAHAALVFTLLFTFFGTFGQAIPLARDAERGLIGRLLFTGIGASRFFLQRITAHALIDAVQLAPCLLVITAAYRLGPPDALALAGALGLALVAANALGAVLGAAARSIGEAALFSAITALLALHAAGVFRSPPPGSAAAQLQGWLPFAGLNDVTAAATRGTIPVASAVQWSTLAAGVLLFLAALTVAAPALARASSRRAYA